MSPCASAAALRSCCAPVPRVVASAPRFCRAEAIVTSAPSAGARRMMSS
nr:hypothetical protein [Deltaproteobacteria bacterium]